MSPQAPSLMPKQRWHYLLLLFLVADLGYSLWQYLQFPLDGDLASLVWPSKGYTPVLHDPLGLRALLHHEMYPAPNRFFAHFFLFEYFHHVPRLLQSMLSPLDSVYAACALLKLAIHALLVYVLAVVISNSRNVLGRDFVLAAVLVTPLLQTSGYNGQMGVMEWAISYTAFYALPVSLLLLFFLPYARQALHDTPAHISALGYVGLLGLAVVLALNGPLIPAIVLIICPTVLLLNWRRHFLAQPRHLAWAQRAAAVAGLPKAQLALFVAFSALSLYSLYIGRYNSENQWASISLGERYARLPLGVYYQLSSKLGLPLLLLLLLVNAWLIRRRISAPLGGRTLRALRWLALFSLVYILLLPLGGYRAYREYIIRRDTILPVLIGMMGCFALSAYCLLTYLPAPARRWYGAVMVAVGALFTVADKPRPSDFNACQRRQFTTLATSRESIVRLPADCPVLEWDPITDYRKSELGGNMLAYWGITQTPKRYYQK